VNITHRCAKDNTDFRFGVVSSKSEKIFGESHYIKEKRNDRGKKK
jgi:hypothetical protein